MTPVSPPQPAEPFGPVDQLTTPTMAGPVCLSSNTGAAGISGAGAEPVARALAHGIDQTNLQRARLAGRDQSGDADGAAALAVAAHGDADAGDREAAADDDGDVGQAERRRRLALGGRTQLQQRHIGRRAMRQHRLHVEAGMNGDALDILQRRLPVRAIFDDLVVGAGLHAMRRGQHDFRRDHGAGAEIAARTDDGDDRAADTLGGRRAAAHDGVSGNGQQQRKAGDGARQDFHRRSNSPRGRHRQAAERTGSSGHSVLAAPQRVSFGRE